MTLLALAPARFAGTFTFTSRILDNTTPAEVQTMAQGLAQNHDVGVDLYINTSHDRRVAIRSHGQASEVASKQGATTYVVTTTSGTTENVEAFDEAFYHRLQRNMDFIESSQLPAKLPTPAIEHTLLRDPNGIGNDRALMMYSPNSPANARHGSIETF